MTLRSATAIASVLLLSALPSMPAADDTGGDARLDLNKATEQQLIELPHIGRAFAKSIIAMRERNGAFRCVEELRAVPRLPEKHFAEILPLLKVEGGRTDCAVLEQRRRQNGRASGSSSL